MISENWGYAYFANWFVGVILTLIIRSRIKKYHPELFDHLYAKTLSEHTIEKSLVYTKFTFSSSAWSGLNDPTLIKLLHVERVIGFFVVAPLALFFGGLVIAILLEIWTAL